jgi:hypothetical protein
MFHMEATVTVKKGCWSAGSEEDEVSLETLLIDDRSAFERGEDGTFGLRETKLDSTSGSTTSTASIAIKSCSRPVC